MNEPTLLISAETLQARLDRGEDLVVIDCQAELTDPVAGHRAWQAAHIPGAVHADLETDLSGKTSPQSGRHPLPHPNTLAEKVGGWGIQRETPVVVYDDSGGAFACRGWWLLRWLGVEQVSLLDGGLSAWRAAGGAVAQGGEANQPVQFEMKVGCMPVVHTPMVQTGIADGEMRLIDARGAKRFLGEEEPIDSVAGHIPGAVNLPFADNLDEQGFWRSPKDLRDRFDSVLPPFTPNETAHMCGSGVSACHNLFAMELAGLGGSSLYAGSWSEWIRNPSRPVA